MKRRDFITQTSLATAGILATSGCMSATKKPQKLNEIGFQVYTVRNQVKDNLNPTLERLAKVGYDYAELYGLYADKVMGLPIADVKNAFSDAGIEIRSSHCMTGVEAMDTKGTMRNEWQMGVDAAAELGAKHLVCAYLVGEERQSLDHYKRIAALLNKSGEIAKKSGIQLGYHNHSFEFDELEGQIPMEILLSETDPEFVKWEMDIYWAVNAKKDPTALFKKHSGRIDLWHVKDMKTTPENGMTEVGKGNIDWKSIFAKSDVSGMTSFFVEQDGNWTNSDVESLETSHGFLSQLEY